MTDVEGADDGPQSPLRRYSSIKHTYDRDERGNLTAIEEQVVSTMPRPRKPRHQDFWGAARISTMCVDL